MESQQPTDAQEGQTQRPSPMTAVERRILGVLMEKARTTPDSYPLTLNALVTGCNQKTAREPVMQLSEDQVDEALVELRQRGIVAEVHGAGRVPKYRHMGYDYFGVKGEEAAVITELLLRGPQTLGDLRARASRLCHSPIPDLNALQAILGKLKEKELVVELTPPGRGQLITHNLYPEEELAVVRVHAVSGATVGESSGPRSGRSEVIETLQHELAELRQEVDQLRQRIETLEQSQKQS
ncbi:MAG: UPF0502 protein [Pirellulaceae bacterium]|nr:MAG: UPF0502 protein [Pirellulaceae bacterium]